MTFAVEWALKANDLSTSFCCCSPRLCTRLSNIIIYYSQLKGGRENRFTSRTVIRLINTFCLTSDHRFSFMPQVSGATVSIATSPSPSNKMETIQGVVSHYVPFVPGKQLVASGDDFGMSRGGQMR